MDKKKNITAAVVAGIATIGLTVGCVVGIPKLIDKNKTEIVKPAPNPGDTTEPDAPLTHTVKFIYGATEVTQTVATGGFPTIEAFTTVEGQRFVGWYLDDVLVEDPFTTAVTQDVTYTAKFEQALNVTFNVDGVETSQFVFNGEFASLQEPTKEGFTFQGWSIDGETVVDISTYQITEDTVFIAVFEENIETTNEDLFTFDGEILTGYTGTETNIVIPKSYSLGEVITETKEYFDFYELLGFVEQNENLTTDLIDSNEVSLKAITIDSLFENQDLLSFPVTITYQRQSYIKGTDFRVKEIGEYAFQNNTNITSVTITSNISLINNCSFMGCSNLLNVTIPNSVTNIGWSAFQNCTSLTSIKLPTKLEILGTMAFSGCTELEGEISIPNTITSFGRRVFDNTKITTYNKISETDEGKYLGNEENPYLVFVETETKDITEYVIHEDCRVVGGFAFYNCKSLTKVTIPYGVVTLDEGTFYSCEILNDLEIPDTVTTIGPEAFFNCYALTDIILSNNVTSIGRNAFASCKSLTSISLPETVTMLYVNVFSNCKSLNKIIIKSTTIPTILADIIPNTTCVVYVQDDLLETYKTTDIWSTHADQYKAISELEEA